MANKKLYAGQKKVAKDIERKLEKESKKDNSKLDAKRKVHYYNKLLNKNKK